MAGRYDSRSTVVNPAAKGDYGPHVRDRPPLRGEHAPVGGEQSPSATKSGTDTAATPYNYRHAEDLAPLCFCALAIAIIRAKLTIIAVAPQRCIHPAMGRSYDAIKGVVATRSHSSRSLEETSLTLQWKSKTHSPRLAAGGRCGWEVRQPKHGCHPSRKGRLRSPPTRQASLKRRARRSVGGPVEP